jgi:hypothetical protein
VIFTLYHKASENVLLLTLKELRLEQKSYARNVEGENSLLLRKGFP